MTTATTTAAPKTTAVKISKTAAAAPKANGKPAAAPKNAKPAAAAEKTTAAAKPAAESNGKAPRAKKDGLRGPQVRVLTFLAKVTGPASRAAIAKGAKVDQAWLTTWIGSQDEAVRKANDEKECTSLITLGHVKAGQYDIDGRDTICYTITAAGRKAVEKANAAAKAK